MSDSLIEAVPPPALAATAELIGRFDAAGAQRLAARSAGLLEREAPATPAGGLAPWQVRRLRALVEANLAETLAITGLAQAVRLSASYLHRAFKTSFGETPHDYILRRRVARAQQRMLETRDPLAQVALDCGLSDQAHLCRVFRRFTGESPSAWRRRCRAS